MSIVGASRPFASAGAAGGSSIRTVIFGGEGPLAAYACFLPCRLDLLVVDEKHLALADFVAAAFLVRPHDLAGHGIDKLLTEAIARLPVHLPERNPLGRRDRRIEGDRAGYERELEVTPPLRTRHSILQTRERQDSIRWPASHSFKPARKDSGTRVLVQTSRTRLVPGMFLRQIRRMVTTLGDALDAGWRLHLRCAWGRREGLKSIRECKEGWTPTCRR
jgi:hypothetical protein